MQDKELTVRAAELARMAPQAWNEFVKAFGATTECFKNALVQHDTAYTLQVAQGRAQAAASLHALFVSAVKDADGRYAKRV